MTVQIGTLMSAPSFLGDLVSMTTPAVDMDEGQENSDLDVRPLSMGVVSPLDFVFSAMRGSVGNAIVSLELGSYLGIGVGSILPIIAAQALARQVNESNAEHPCIWFVGFPANMDDDQRRTLARYQQNMMDFRCWSSLKWWQEVYRQIPNGFNIDYQVNQGRLFAQVACQEMVKMDWLQTLREPREVSTNFECSPRDVHAGIIFQTVADMVGDPEIAADVVEPVLQSIVASIAQGVQMARQLKTVIAERYEYVSGEIRSYVRMLCFEMAEGMHDVQTGKNSSERRVRVNFSFIQYEATFNMPAWEQYSLHLQQHEKEAMKEFVERQSYDIPVS